MKRLIAALCVTCALTLAVHAEDATTKPKHEMSPAMKELVTKYDLNKDGKLDKDEVAKMSTDDKAKYEKLHTMHKKHMDAPKEMPAGTNAPAMK